MIQVTIREATEDDLDKFKNIVSERKRGFFRETFKKGRICFIALVGEKIAYLCWISFEDEYESNCRIRAKFNRKKAYLFDGYTVPQYRENRLHTPMITKRLVYPKNKGYGKARLLVWNENTYARKVVTKAGFKGKRIVTLIELFGFEFHIWRKFRGSFKIWKTNLRISLQT